MQLAEALKQATGLTTLDLGGNSMGPTGIEGQLACTLSTPPPDSQTVVVSACPVCLRV